MEKSKESLFQQLKSKQDDPSSLLRLDEFSNEDKMPPTNEPQKEKPTYKKGWDYALRILAIKDYSIHKMKEKLKMRGISREDSEKIIQKLLELNYLREHEYTKMRIKSLLTKGYSNSYIIRKLSQEHLNTNSEEINEIRSEQDLHSSTQLEYLIQKKLRGKTIPQDFESKMKLKNKIISFLASKGYNYEEIKTGIEKFIK